MIFMLKRYLAKYELRYKSLYFTDIRILKLFFSQESLPLDNIAFNSAFGRYFRRKISGKPKDKGVYNSASLSHLHWGRRPYHFFVLKVECPPT